MPDAHEILQPESHDGTSQRGRALPALDPNYVVIDERTTADLLEFVGEFVKYLKFEKPDGTSEDWTKFATHNDLGAADIVAYIADPNRFEGEQARWLGRPHFALLLAFLELLGHARTQLNGLTRRHLEYYYREVLQMQPELPIPDRVAVVFRLSPRATSLHLPAGTGLKAGRDSRGVVRVYRTERDLFVNRTQVASLRSIFVDREITRLVDVWEERPPGHEDQAFQQMLEIALGDPQPGGSVPGLNGSTGVDFFVARARVIGFATERLGLAHHQELRALLGLGSQLTPPIDQDPKWPTFHDRLQGIGRTIRNNPNWVLSVNPGVSVANVWNAVLQPLNLAAIFAPLQINSIAAHDEAIRDLERDFSMPVQQLAHLAAAAEALDEPKDLDEATWSKLEDILADAHVEKSRAARTAALELLFDDKSGVEKFDALVSHVLGEEEIADWDITANRIAGYVQPIQADFIESFRGQLVHDTLTLEWSDLYRVLELVQRSVQRLEDPIAELIEWHNLYAFEDATKVLDDPTSTRWKTFGQVPVDTDVPPGTLGWALRSPALALSGGERTITLTFTCTGELAGNTPLASVLSIEFTTAKGWMASPSGGLNQQLTAQFVIPASFPPIEPLAGSGEQWPTLRILLSQHEGITHYTAFESLNIVEVQVDISVVGLTNLQLQQEDRVIDSRKPFEPFGSRPVVGSRLYFSHPELARQPLLTMGGRIEWMGLPANEVTYYANYPLPFDVTQARYELAKIEDQVAFPISSDNDFVPPPSPPGPGAALVQTRRLDITPTPDIRDASRYFRIELTGSDFGHSIYPTAAANLASELAMKLATGAITPQNIQTEAPKFKINPPYTPTIKQITVNYTTSLTLDPSEPNGVDELLHVHPFGVVPMGPHATTLFPRYDNAGELYIGLRDVAAPQSLSLLVQLAEGTSDPDAEPAVVKWAYLDENRWHNCDVAFDSTRGLINSGIVELRLPVVAPSKLLPTGLYWLRVAVNRNPQSVCDAISIRPQAVSVRFDDRGNAPEHYDQPLPVGSIDRLLVPDARIAAIEQPYTSFGGAPAERDEVFHTRVSERLRHKQRALTAWDYERLVLHRFRQIFKARCIRANTDEPGRVDVIVIPDIRNALPGDPFAPNAPANLLADIRTYLAERSPAAVDIRVRNAKYLPVILRLVVRFQAGWDEGYARKQLNEDLNRFLSPWAYDKGAEIELAGKIYANSVLDFVDRLEYIDFVANLGLTTLEDGKAHPATINSSGEHFVAAGGLDTVLVAAPQHHIEVLSEFDNPFELNTGIGYMKVELDFIIA